MGAAYFYHLTDSPLEATLPMLLGKARQAGWRVLVRGTDRALLERLDRVLWEQSPDSFIPHGLSGGEHDADQPILLGDVATSDGFDCVMSVGGADISTEEVATLERCCILFDGHDGVALETARNQWRQMKEAQLTAQYWAQEDDRWMQKASTG